MKRTTKIWKIIIYTIDIIGLILFPTAMILNITETTNNNTDLIAMISSVILIAFMIFFIGAFNNEMKDSGLKSLNTIKIMTADYESLSDEDLHVLMEILEQIRFRKSVEKGGTLEEFLIANSDDHEDFKNPLAWAWKEYFQVKQNLENVHKTIVELTREAVVNGDEKIINTITRIELGIIKKTIKIELPECENYNKWIKPTEEEK